MRCSLNLLERTHDDILEISTLTLVPAQAVYAPRDLFDGERHCRNANHFPRAVRPRIESAAQETGHAARDLSFLRLRISGALFTVGRGSGRAAARDHRAGP